MTGPREFEIPLSCLFMKSNKLQGEAEMVTNLKRRKKIRKFFAPHTEKN